MTHPAETTCELVSLNELTTGRAAVYQLVTLLIMLSGLLVVTTAPVNANMTTALPEPVKASLKPVVSQDGPGIFESSNRAGEEPFQFLSKQPTRTPRPTATPPVIPPPASAGTTSLMILLAVLIMAVILIGVWINRRRVV